MLLTLANLALRSVSLFFQVYLADVIGAAGMGKMQLVLTAGSFAMTLGSSGVRVASMNLTAQEWGKGNPSGMKKVCYTHLNLPMVAVEDFGKVGETDPLFAKLHEIVEENGGLWCAKAEDYLLANAPRIEEK